MVKWKGWWLVNCFFASDFVFSFVGSKESYCIHELEPGYEKMGVNTRHV